MTATVCVSSSRAVPEEEEPVAEAPGTVEDEARGATEVVAAEAEEEVNGVVVVAVKVMEAVVVAATTARTRNAASTASWSRDSRTLVRGRT